MHELNQARNSNHTTSDPPASLKHVCGLANSYVANFKAINSKYNTIQSK